MYVILMIITILAVLLLVFVLMRYVFLIKELLASIGGDPVSYLAKLRLGLNAIEMETAHLPVQLSELNSALAETAKGLEAVDSHLIRTIEAVNNQKNK